jgi:hypothetical protein
MPVQQHSVPVGIPSTTVVTGRGPRIGFVQTAQGETVSTGRQYQILHH